MSLPIYLDYAATSPVDDDALAAAAPYYKNVFFNPSSAHAAGQLAARALDAARERCAAAINAAPREICFTSGGTEAVNLAMKGVDYSQRRRVVISGIEHDCVIACAEYLKNAGVSVDTVMPDGYGIITPDALARVLKDDTALVCVMTVNNITGAIQPIDALCALTHEHGALFFTDAVQAVNSLDLNVKKSGVDMLAASAHKFYGQKGAGFLYVRSGVRLKPVLAGGEQERGLRGGTQNVTGIVAMGAAIQKASAMRAEYAAHAKAVSSEFLKTLRYGRAVETTQKTDDIASVIFGGVNGGRLAVALSCAGVCCSVGSACSAGSATPPTALVNMGVENADCAVRFSFGRGVSLTAARRAARIVNAVVKRLSGL